MGVGGIDAGGGHVGASQGSGGSGGGTPFEELYGQSFGRLYDFAIRMLRDREEAALAVQASYLAVYQELQAGETYVSFPVQLYSAAHRDIADRLRRRRGPVPDLPDALDTPDAVWAGDPAVSANANELASTVWEVASLARPEELELLDLRLRQGLNDDEVAAVLRTRPETVRNRTERLEGALEESYSGLLLMRRGRQACVDLDFLIGDAVWSMSVRKRVLRHLQTCQVCQRTRAAFPPATNVYAALAPVEAPRGWQDAMLARLTELAGGAFGSIAAAGLAVAAPIEPRPAPRPPSRAAPPASRPAAEPTGAAYGGGGGGIGGWASDMFSTGDARGPLLAMLLGAMLVLVVVLAALCGAGAFDGGGGGGGSDETPTPSPSITPTGSPTAAPSPSPSVSPTFAPFPTEVPPLPTVPPPPPTNTVPPPPPTNTRPPPPPTSTSPPVVTPPAGP